jgi:hypothetical protein
MTTLFRSQAGCGVYAPIKPSTIKRSLARYPVWHRSRIFGLASRHGRLADLAVTFPGLLFALAVRERDGTDAIELTIRGAPLKRVAVAAGVPLWLRKLPPEAFAAPFAGLPDGEQFRRRIANYLPSAPRLAASWLASVRMALEWGDDDLAVWIAREILRGCGMVKSEWLQLLALYSWYSRRPQTVAHQFLRKRWDAGMGYDRALIEAEAWREALGLRLDLANRCLDPWLKPAMVMGFEFVPLLTADEIAQEAKIMRNCVQQCSFSLARNRQRLWSVRRGGERVATLSVGFGGRPILDILQLKGPANIEAPKTVWVAALRWIDQHDLMAIEWACLSAHDVPVDRTAWIALWRPYWLAKRRIPSWLPLTPSRAVLRRLQYSRA